MTIDELYEYLEVMMLKRKLTGDEILVMGIAFVQGMIAEKEKGKK